MLITVIWSKSQPGEKFQCGGRVFFKTGSSCISTVNWDIFDEIWFADRFWLLEERNVIRYETGSSSAPPRLPSWKSIRRHIFAAGGPMWMKFGLAYRFWSSEDSDINKYEAISSTEPPLSPSWNCIWRHYSVAGGPIWTKFGSMMQNSTQITAIWSKSQREKNSNMADDVYF